MVNHIHSTVAGSVSESLKLHKWDELLAAVTLFSGIMWSVSIGCWLAALK